MTARLPTQKELERAIEEARAKGLDRVEVPFGDGKSIVYEGLFRPARDYDEQRSAEYCRCTPAQFKAFVKEGLLPKPIRKGTWAKVDLDKALERIDVRPRGPAFEQVYFIEMGEFIKIGFSAYAYSRMDNLQSSNPYELKLLATFEGNEDCEQRVHALFAHLRHRGEWFRKSKGLLAYVAWIKARKP